MNSGTTKNYAGIDLGSNTIRLLVGRLENSKLHTIYKDLSITRLGSDFYSTSAISKKSWEKSLKVLNEYSDIIREHNVSALSVCATGVLRLAKNAADFVAAVKSETGLDITIISGEQEARLAALGVTSVVSAKKSVIFDVGGGSTEFIITKGDDIKFADSVDIGAVTLYESCVESDPPTHADLEKMSRHIKQALSDCKDSLISALPDDYDLIFTAGTATTLAAIKLGMGVYDSDRVNNTLMTSTEARAIYDELISKNKSDRAAIVGLEKGREDIIISGSAIALNVMEMFSKDQMTISDAGLLEGIVINTCRRDR